MPWWLGFVQTKLLSDVVSGAVSGIVAGTVLAVALYLANRFRNWKLERDLRRGFARSGASIGDGGFALVVENRLPITVRVRTIFLVQAKGPGIGEGGLELQYLRPVAHAALFNALAQSSSPTRIDVSAHFAAKADGESGTPLAGFSGGLWGVGYKDILRQPWLIEDGWMILEYPTLLRGAAFIRIHLDQATLGLVRQAIADIRGEAMQRR